MARDLGVPEHYLRLAVGARRKPAFDRRRGRLAAHLAIDEEELRLRNRLQRPDCGVVVDMAPGRDASAALFFAHLYRYAERARVRW